MTVDSPWKEVSLVDGDAALAAFERAGSGTPIVLLHGAGANALTWLPVEPAFGDRRVLLVDMPAHGASASPRSWALDDTAAIVARAVRRHLGDVPAVWGGHSWGGKVAGLVAASGSAPCEGLLLVDPSPSAPVPVPIEDFVDGVWSTELLRYPNREDAEAAARTLDHWQPWNETMAVAFRHGLARQEDGSWSLKPTRDELIALATATLHHDSTESLAKNAGTRTLLLIAAESEPWQAMTNAQVYAHATQQVIPGNHWLHLSASDAVTRAVTAWL